MTKKAEKTESVVLKHFEETDPEALRLFDEEMFDEISYHMGYVEDSARIAYKENEIAGVGYLVANHAHELALEFHSAKDSIGAVAAMAIFPELLREAKKYFSRYKDGCGTVITYCGQKEDSYFEFLTEYGFRERNVMLRMARKIEESEKPIRLPLHTKFREYPILSQGKMREFRAFTKEAYGFPDTEEEIRFEIAYRSAEIFALYLDEEPVSFVTTWEMKGHHGKSISHATETVFTRKNFRKKGYATMVLQCVAERIAHKGGTRAVLTTYQDNKEAISVYHNCGYKKIGAMREMYCEL